MCYFCFMFASLTLCRLRRGCVRFAQVVSLREVVSASPRLCAFGGCRVLTIHRCVAAFTSRRDIPHAPRANLEAPLRIPSILPRASWARGKRSNCGRPKSQSDFIATSELRRRAAYGNRTRLLGLGSRCTTDVLMPQIRLQKYYFFFICANISTIFFCTFGYVQIFLYLCGKL